MKNGNTVLIIAVILVIGAIAWAYMDRQKNGSDGRFSAREANGDQNQDKKDTVKCVYRNSAGQEVTITGPNNDEFIEHCKKKTGSEGTYFANQLYYPLYYYTYPGYYYYYPQYYYRTYWPSYYGGWRNRMWHI